jgi:hypothetical protein
MKKKVHNVSSTHFVAHDLRNPDLMAGQLIGKAKYVVFWDREEQMCEQRPTLVADWLSSDSVALPYSILEILDEEFFQNADPIKHNPVIHGYTEYRLSTGEIVRAHPNYGGKGPIYDWAIIKDPTDRYDYLHQATIPQLLDQHNNPILSRVEHQYPNHVPCRLLSFFIHPDNGIEMAIVHACRPWSLRNHEHSSVITESWNLQVVIQNFWQNTDGVFSTEKNSKNDISVKRLVPMYHVIPVCDIKQGLFAVQEDDVLAESWPYSNASGHAILVHDRDIYWSDEFLKY